MVDFPGRTFYKKHATEDVWYVDNEELAAKIAEETDIAYEIVYEVLCKETELLEETGIVGVVEN